VTFRRWTPVPLLLVLAATACSVAAGQAASPLPTPSVGAAAPASSSLPPPGPILAPGKTYVATPTTPKLNLALHPFKATGPTSTFSSTNAFGQKVSFLVDRAKRDAAGDPWVLIQLGVKPNESTAWVPGREVSLSPVRDRIVVDLSQRTLRLYVGNKLKEHFSVGVGQPQWPTTPGSFYVWAKVPEGDPYGPYGVYALGLSGFSTVLTEWPGGGRMAIHGTSNPADRGQAVSHGCVRVYNPDMTILKSVPMGTPVVIKR